MVSLSEEAGKKGWGGEKKRGKRRISLFLFEPQTLQKPDDDEGLCCGARDAFVVIRPNQ